MPIPATVTAIARPLAREEIYRTLKDWIVNLTLAPDEIIRDLDLAERLGVSRTPVREALRQLEDEGLVVTSFHKWTKVAPADLDEVRHLYPVVAALEAAAVQSLVGGFRIEQWKQRPFRSPHHTSSGAALVGGGCQFQIKRRFFT